MTDQLREQVAEALNTAHIPNVPEFEALDETSRHDGHHFFGGCYVCRGDVAKLTDAVLEAVAPLLDRERSSRQAWAEEAGRLGKFRQMVHMLLGYTPDVTADSEVLRKLEKLALAWQRGHTAPWSEVERLRREVEFEANSERYSHDTDLSLRPCACPTPEQAATLDPRWSPPQCSVHPDRGEEGEERSGRVVSGHASREELRRETGGSGADHFGCAGAGHGTATPAPLSSPPTLGVLPEGGTPDAD